MSFIPIATGLLQAASIVEGLLAGIFIRVRGVGSPLTGFFFPDITVEEVHRDRLVITDHPVEQNAAISDHAYKNPVEVTLRYGFSNSSLQAFGDPNYVQNVYTSFLTMQQSRQLLTIFTGKRVYVNMLIEEITERTDQHTENAMVLEIMCREVILVSTSQLQLPSNSVQADPAKTGGTTNTGAGNLGDAPNFNAAATN